MKRQQQTSTHNTLDRSRVVTFKRDILVTNPKNRFENQRFGIELSDERGTGESYEVVYNRLRMAGERILLSEIVQYKYGVQRTLFSDAMRNVAKDYNLGFDHGH